MKKISLFFLWAMLISLKSTNAVGHASNIQFTTMGIEAGGSGVIYNLTDTVISPCPWEVIDIESFHGNELVSLNLKLPRIQPPDWPETGAFGNPNAKIGDWLGIFYRDTCFFAIMYESISKNFSIYVPEYISLDSLKFKVFNFDCYIESNASIYSSQSNYHNWLQNPSQYLSLGCIPEWFCPTYINLDSQLVYNYNYFAGGNYLMINQNQIEVTHDTIITDTIFTCFHDLNGIIYIDSTNLTLSYPYFKAIKRQIIVGQDTTGISSFQKENFVIIPNPARDYFFIRGIKNPKIEIISITGVVLLITNGNEINISQLPTGMYLCKIGNKIQKFIVSK